MSDTKAFVCFQQDMSTVMSSAMDTAIRYDGGSKMIDIGKELQKAYDDGFKKGEFEVLNFLSSVWHGKQYYFMENEAKGIIYSRDSCTYMTLDEAIEEFANRIGDDGSL